MISVPLAHARQAKKNRPLGAGSVVRHARRKKRGATLNQALLDAVLLFGLLAPLVQQRFSVAIGL